MSSLRHPLDRHANYSNQEYVGLGMLRYCVKCKSHKSLAGGSTIPMFGGRHWVCMTCKPEKERLKRKAA